MAIQVGIAPDSWGVWFPDDDRQMHWRRCLDEMQAAGYAGVEMGPWGYLPNDFETLKGELERRDLRLVSATVGGNFADDRSTEEMCETIKDIAELLIRFQQPTYIVILPDMYTDAMTGKDVLPRELTDTQWEKLYRNVQRTGKLIDSCGLVPALHPHVDSYIQTEEQIERVLAHTDITLCFDTGHHIYGGGDPVSFYKKHHDRIPFLHIKECDVRIQEQMRANGWSFAKAVAAGIMCEPGKGKIDFRDLFDFMKQIEYSGWIVVEQDMYPVSDMSQPLEIAARTRENLKELLDR